MYSLSTNAREFQRLNDAIKRLKKSERRLKRLVYVDTLTGAGNVRMRDLMMEKNVSRYGRLKDDFCIIIIDIDGLKPINDKLGHAEGDKLIKKSAKIMFDTVRTYDTVCRIGGDEFIIITPQASYSQGKKLMLRIVNECKKDNISVSAGVASLYENFNKEGKDINEISKNMVSRADERMYLMKRTHHKGKRPR